MEYSTLAEQRAGLLRRQADRLEQCSRRLREEKEKINRAWVSAEMETINTSIDHQLKQINRVVRELDALYLDIRQAAADLDAEQIAKS